MATLNQPFFEDGDYSTPVRISRTPREYPFAHLGDLTVYIYSATYVVDQGKFTATARGTADPENASAVLLGETKPEIYQGVLCTFVRTYATVPGTQTDSDNSIMVNRPGVALGAVGSYRVFQPDTTQAKYDAYERGTITSDSGAPSTFRPTGGTGTASFGGSTTAATNHNAVAGTWQTNLNALTPISNRGSLVVTGGPLSAADLTVTFNSYAAATIGVGSLTGSTGSATATAVNTSNGGYSQAVTINRTNIDAPAPAVGNSITWSSGTPSATTQLTFNGFPPVNTRIDWIFYATSFTATPTGGTFTLTAYGQTTAAIAYNASDATILAAINLALTNLTARGTLTLSVLRNTFNGYLGWPDIMISASIVPLITGGTYTITIFGQTTAAIAYNASVGTIEAALNALSEVATKRGGCTVTGSGWDGISVVAFGINFSNAALTFDVSALTPTGCTATITVTDGGIGRIQTISVAAPSATRTLYVAAGHNIDVADTIMLHNGAADYPAIAGVFTIPDPYTLILTVLPGVSYQSAATLTEMGRRTKQDYAPGSASCKCDLVTRYSLAAIEPDTYQGDDASFLQAIFSGSTAINYRVGDSTRWPSSSSPIRSLTTTRVSAANL